MSQIFRLRASDQHVFSAKPESGMGFQVVLGETSLGRSGRFVILESLIVLGARTRTELREALQELGERGAEEIDDFEAEEGRFSGKTIIAESRLPTPEIAQAQSDDAAPIQKPARGLFPKTALVVTRHTAKPQAFLRFSARRQDPRVDPLTGDFKSGTYAAPWSEAPLVPSGFAAVARYALPNPFAARRMYPIVTASSPQIIGAAAPNYGQSGGGVEVLFPNGAKALYGQPHVIAAF